MFLAFAEFPLATPLAAFLRVPLSWYHSATVAFFPDEQQSQIRRVYTHASQQHARRHFCGFCGTPLTYWTEEPRSEAEFMQVTLGSLASEDLRDLEELGLIPESEEEEDEGDEGEHQKKKRKTAGGASGEFSVVGRESRGVPWFDSLVEGTRLGKMRRSQVVEETRDGKVWVEWEIVEWTADDVDDISDEGSGDVDMDLQEEKTGPGAKRKLQDRDEAGTAV